MPGTLHQCPGSTPVGVPVVLLTDIYGGVPFYHELARRLAAHGHPTLLPDLFTREGPLDEVTREAAYARHARMDEPQAVDDALAAVEYLGLRYDSATVGTVGFCLGGLLGFHTATRREHLRTVSYYGFPEGMPRPARVPMTRPVDAYAGMHGPVLAFWGEDDHLVPAEVVERFGQTLRARGVAYAAHTYSGAGHGFLQGLVEERADSPAARDSWRRALHLLATGSFATTDTLRPTRLEGDAS